MNEMFVWNIEAKKYIVSMVTLWQLFLWPLQGRVLNLGMDILVMLNVNLLWTNDQTRKNGKKKLQTNISHQTAWMIKALSWAGEIQKLENINLGRIKKEEKSSSGLMFAKSQNLKV